MMTSPSKKILWIDIETAPLYSLEKDVPEDVIKIREKRYCSDRPDDKTPFERYFQRSPLFAEFSQIVCISTGYEINGEFVMKSLIGDEIDILEQFRSFLEKASGWTLGGHNIKGYDVPFIAKRFVIHGMVLPATIITAGKKQWEIDFVDTMEIRKMGGYAASSLELLCITLGIPTPKDDIDGSQVGTLFFSDDPQKMQRIVTYCEKDVEAVYRCYKRMNRENEIVAGTNEITEVSDEFVGLYFWKSFTGITDFDNMTRSQKHRFNKFIADYHADNKTS